jgi:transcriptional regulator with XRE-family HTH domain
MVRRTNVPPLADNVRRLLGIHAMTISLGSQHIGVSPQALSEIQSGTRTQPSLTTVRALANFFEVPTDRLLDARFGDLLQAELADRDRFERVEAKLRDSGARHRRGSSR